MLCFIDIHVYIVRKRKFIILCSIEICIIRTNLKTNIMIRGVGVSCVS